MNRVKRLFVFSSSGVVAGLVLLLAYLVGALDGLEKKVAGIRSLEMSAMGDCPIVVIEIADLGNNRWPWPRLDYALMLRAVGAFDPKLVAIESPMVGGDTFYENYDRLLAESNKRVAKVIYPAAALKVGEAVVLPTNVKTIPYEGSVDSLPDYKSAFLPNPVFARGGEIGFANMGYDADGIVRSVPLIYRFGAQVMPSWVLSIYGTMKGVDWLKSRVVLGGEIILRNSKEEEVGRIPIDEQGRAEIRYREKKKWMKVEFGDALLSSEQMLSGKKPVVDLNVLRGKGIIIGRANDEAVEKVKTPLGEMYPVDVHAQMLANFFQNDFRRILPEWMVWGLIVGLAAFSAATMMITQRAIRFAAGLMMVLGGVLYKLGFSVFNISAPCATFVCAIVLGLVAGCLLRIFSRV